MRRGKSEKKIRKVEGLASERGDRKMEDGDTVEVGLWKCIPNSLRSPEK